MRVIHTIFNQLFPPHCRGCGASGTFACSSCLAKAASNKKYTVCFFCGHSCDEKRICQMCAKAFQLDSIFWALSYNTPFTKTLISSYKYKHNKAAHHAIGPWFAQQITRNINSYPIDIVVPIPLHPIKLRSRGFNQAELLSSHLPYPLATDTLIRVKFSPPQARSKNKQERFHLIKDSFRVPDQINVTGKHILLVDDVATTGATLSEAAHMLMRAGAKSISAATLAHG